MTGTLLSNSSLVWNVTNDAGTAPYVAVADDLFGAGAAVTLTGIGQA